MADDGRLALNRLVSRTYDKLENGEARSTQLHTFRPLPNNGRGTAFHDKKSKLLNGAGSMEEKWQA